MSNTTAEIKNSWSLLSFASQHERMFVGDFEHVDEETGEIRQFSSCVFTDGDAKTFVSFSPKLGELDEGQIVERKDDLQVVEWEIPGTEKHGYTLCNKSKKAWREVKLQ